MSRKVIFPLLLLTVVFIFAFAFRLLVKRQHRAKRGPPSFENVTKEAGVRNHASTFGNATIGDFNGDGFPDFFFGNHSGLAPKLYRNNGNGTFAEIIASTGIDIGRLDRHGSAWGDFDNDGDLDLYIAVGAKGGKTIGTKRDQFYRNNGDGTFTNITEQAGVMNMNGRSRSINWVDYDNDGLLDIFIKNIGSENVLYHNNGDGTFVDTAGAVGLAGAQGEFSAWADFDNDRDMDLVTGGNLQLWRNDRGKFVEIGNSAGFHAFIRSASWGDYDNDGLLDLFVPGRVRQEDDVFIQNENAIAFSATKQTESGLDFKTSTDKIEFDLYIRNCHRYENVVLGNNQNKMLRFPITLSANEARGKPSLLTSKDIEYFIWSDSEGWHFRCRSGAEGAEPIFGIIVTRGTFSSVRGIGLIVSENGSANHLYKNNGDGTFTDISEKTGVRSGGHGQTASWGDFDNDGFLDLYEVDAGNILKNAPGKLFHNAKGEAFTRVNNQAGIAPAEDGRGDGASWVDYDNDGSLDLLLTNGSHDGLLSREGNCLKMGSYLLYRNLGPTGRWLKVRLVGKKSNRMGIGSHLVLKTGELVVLREMNDPGGGPFYSQGEGPLHFGLGNHRVIDSLQVYWPSGVTQTLSNLPTNQLVTIIEDATRNSSK